MNRRTKRYAEVWEAVMCALAVVIVFAIAAGLFDDGPTPGG